MEFCTELLGIFIKQFAYKPSVYPKLHKKSLGWFLFKAKT